MFFCSRTCRAEARRTPKPPKIPYSTARRVALLRANMLQRRIEAEAAAFMPIFRAWLATNNPRFPEVGP